MLDYQKRVVDEEAELATKTDKLAAFIDENPQFHALSDQERVRLVNQRYFMRSYQKVLRERIEAFLLVKG